MAPIANSIDKPKTARGARELEKRASKIHENDKKTLFIRNVGASETAVNVMKDLYSLKRTMSEHLSGKNQVRPFEDTSFLERMCKKYDTSMFIIASHSKKRPHNLVLGRMFEWEILDCYELGVTRFQSIAELAEETVPLGTKPCLVFSGEFDEDEELKMLKNFLIDFFRGASPEALRLAGVEHVMHFTCLYDSLGKSGASSSRRIQIDSHRVLLKKSGTNVPRTELQPMGPRLELDLRRVRVPNADLWRRSCRQPKAAKIQKKKNVSVDEFGSKVGKIHMEKQDYDKIISLHKAMQRKKAKRLESS